MMRSGAKGLSVPSTIHLCEGWAVHLPFLAHAPLSTMPPSPADVPLALLPAACCAYR